MNFERNESRLKQQKTPKKHVALTEIAKPVEVAEILDDAELEKLSGQWGEFYTSFVSSLIGKVSLEALSTDSLDSRLLDRGTKLVNSVNNRREEQKLLVELKAMTAEDILMPALRALLSEEEIQPFLAQASYRLEETSPGMYAIYLDSKSFRHIKPGSYGLAAKFRDGVSFILIQDYGTDPDNQEIMRRNINENLPHETHHIAWYFMMKDGLIENGEVDSEWQQAFRTYQDELIATMSSEGSLFGYDHFNLCGPEYRAEVAAKTPEKYQAIRATIIQLNEFLGEELNPIIRDTKSSVQELIYVTTNAKTFVDLENGLRRMKTIIEKRPKVVQDLPVSDSPPGWGLI